jgi:hypothetical protein
VPDNELVTICGPEAVLGSGEDREFRWLVDGTGGQPIAQVGVEISSGEATSGTVYLDYLTWDGVPDVELRRPAEGGPMWHRAWVNGIDRFEPHWPESPRLIQNQGRGLLIQGTREWTDYQVRASITPHMVAQAGLAARVQGMRRYYALLLGENGKARLVRELDGEKVLAEADFPLVPAVTYRLSLRVRGNRLQAGVDGEVLFDLEDEPLLSGAVALICEEGCMATDGVTVQPVG